MQWQNFKNFLWGGATAATNMREAYNLDGKGLVCSQAVTPKQTASRR